MFTMYVYVLDTLADWEPGYVISELNSGRSERNKHIAAAGCRYMERPEAWRCHRESRRISFFRGFSMCNMRRYRRACQYRAVG